ncbi:hypothetical protein FQN57_000333 [Myotisia sp. PD_48]|nr:hypothetical protein FQN57_000333 [Myotisia sp. PD_48]
MPQDQESKRAVSKSVFRKSRNACLQCKKRKVKCDEQAPCCHNCKRRRAKCSFETHSIDIPGFTTEESERPAEISWNIPTFLIPAVDSDVVADDDDASTKSNSDLPTWSLTKHSSTLKTGIEGPLALLPGQPGHAISTPTPQEHELMHHYATIVFRSLADYDAWKPVWQIAVPQETQSFRFVKHGLLALSALHIHHLRFGTTNHTNTTPQELAYKELALKHYNTAISDFRLTANQLVLSNLNAVFAFSHLIIFFAFGSSKLAANKGGMQDAIGELLDLFSLLRKSMAVLRVNWNLIEAGNMRVLLHRGPAVRDRQYLTAEVATALELVEDLCMEQTFSSRRQWEEAMEHEHYHETELDLESFDGNGRNNDHSRKVYRLAISQLWDSFVMAETKRKDWGMALRFPMIFSDCLMACFTAREPLALVILAHYCVLLHRAPMRWWAGGWSTQVIGAVCKALPQDWRHAVSWPMTVVKLTPSEL